MAAIVHNHRDAYSEKALTDAMSQEEASSFFDAAARRYLNISGKEFLDRWDAGYFSGSCSDTRATRVAMLIPMVRPTIARKKRF